MICRMEQEMDLFVQITAEQRFKLSPYSKKVAGLISVWSISAWSLHDLPYKGGFSLGTSASSHRQNTCMLRYLTTKLSLCVSTNVNGVLWPGTPCPGCTWPIAQWMKRKWTHGWSRSLRLHFWSPADRPINLRFAANVGMKRVVLGVPWAEVDTEVICMVTNALYRPWTWKQAVIYLKPAHSWPHGSLVTSSQTPVRQ